MMYMRCRPVCGLLLLSCLFALTGRALPVRAQDDADLAGVVQKLGSEQEEEQQKARATLIEAGARAIEPLEDAAWGNDAELAFQAGQVLRMIELGLDPDTPEDVRKLAEGFHEDANATIRPLILQRLSDRGEHGLQSIRAMVLSEREDQIRGRAFQKAAQEMMPALPQLVIDDELEKAEAILWIWAGTGRDDRIADLAAFLRTTDRMDDALSVARNWGEGLASPFRCTVQAFLERAAGHRDRAVEAARRSGQDYLVHVLLIEGGNWAPFARAFDEFTSAESTAQGIAYLLSAHRLAGNEAEFKRTIDRLMQFARRDEDSVSLVAAGLLFNGLPDMAAELLALHGEYDAAVQVRLSQGKAEEARALVEKWHAELAVAAGDGPYRIGPDGELPQEPFQYAELLLQQAREEEARAVLARLNEAVGDAVPPQQKATLAAMLYRTGSVDEAEALILPLLEDEEIGDGGKSAVLNMVLPARNLDTYSLYQSLAALGADAASEETLRRLRSMLKDEVDDENVDGLLARAMEFAEQNPHLWGQSWLADWARFCEQRNMLDRALTLYRAEHELFGTTGALGRAAILARELGRQNLAGELSERGFESEAKVPAAMFLRSISLEEAGEGAAAEALRHDAHVTALARVWQRGALALVMERYEMPDAAHRQRQMIVQAGQFARLDLTAADLYATRLREEGKLDRALWLMEHQALGAMGMGAGGVEVLISGYEYRDIYRAIALLREGKTEEAVDVARGIVERSPGLADSLILLITQLDEHGQNELADELFERIWQAHQARLELFPGQSSHYNTQAWMGSRCGRKLEESLALSQKSLEMEPYSPYFLDTLADVYFMLGQAGKALEKEHLSVHIQASSFTWRQYHRFQKAVEAE